MLSHPCSSSPISFRLGSVDKVVLPVPDKPKKIAVSPLSSTLAEQCIGRVFLYIGRIKFKAEKIPFLISPVYPVPPMRAIFFVKFRIAKLCWRVASRSGSAINPGALITVHSGSKPSSSFSLGRINILYANILDQGYSFTTRKRI